MNITNCLETERPCIRPLRDFDAKDLVEYQSDHRVVRYIPWNVRSHEEVKLAIKSQVNGPIPFEVEGDSLVLGWELKASGKVIRQSNASLISLPNRTANIGWVTHRHYWRQGFAFEASKLVLSLLLQQGAIQKIVASIDTRNLGSANLAKKLGMRREGEFKNSAFTKGEWCDMWLYAVLKGEFADPIAFRGQNKTVENF